METSSLEKAVNAISGLSQKSHSLDKAVSLKDGAFAPSVLVVVGGD